MKQQRVTYTIGDPPKALKRARLDNISLVPASLLVGEKGKYQTITNNLPRGGILICETPYRPRIAHILSQVAAFLRENGHVVRILPYSVLVQIKWGLDATALVLSRKVVPLTGKNTNSSVPNLYKFRFKITRGGSQKNTVTQRTGLSRLRNPERWKFLHDYRKVTFSLPFVTIGALQAGYYC